MSNAPPELTLGVCNGQTLLSTGYSNFSAVDYDAQSWAQWIGGGNRYENADASFYSRAAAAQLSPRISGSLHTIDMMLGPPVPSSPYCTRIEGNVTVTLYSDNGTNNFGLPIAL